MRDYPTLHLDINKSKETACSKKSYGSKRTWDYPTLHLDINKSKETACSKKTYGSNRTWETIPHYT
jgi:uncharacterized Zn-finger protein